MSDSLTMNLFNELAQTLLIGLSLVLLPQRLDSHVFVQSSVLTLVVARASIRETVNLHYGVVSIASSPDRRSNSAVVSFLVTQTTTSNTSVLRDCRVFRMSQPS